MLEEALDRAALPAASRPSKSTTTAAGVLHPGLHLQQLDLQVAL